MTQQSTNKTSKGFYAFAEHLIDYAGLFPPANLDLETVVKNYIHHREGPYSWMLGKLICPVSRLKEMGEILKQYGLKESIEVIALVTRETTFEEVRDEIESFHDKNAEIAQINSIEAKFSKNLLELTKLYDAYIETSDPKEILEIADAECNLKVRCGGISPSDFPTAEKLANMILIAIKNEVKLKFTAGLHHPLHHYSKDVGCNMHGFVNIFAGVILANKYDPSQEELQEFFLDEDPNNFRFDDQGFHWNDLSIETKSIEIARRCVVHSYGSCSFDEPITDLKTLGWLS